MKLRRASASTTCSGVSTSRTLASRPGEQGAHLVELGVQPLDRGEDVVLGHRHARGAGQHRLAAPCTTRRSTGKTRVMYQPSASGSASSRSVSAVGAQSTTTTSHSSDERVQPQLEEREHLLGARDHGQLLGRHRVDPGDLEHREQVALDLGPRLLEPQLGVDLVDEQVRARPRCGSAPTVTPKASASEWAASVDSTSVRWPGRGGEGRRGGRDGRLADAALAGEEEDPHEPRSVSPVSERLDALLEPLQRGVDEDLLALALEHPDQRDRDVEGQPVGHVGRAVAEVGEHVGAVEGAQHLALDSVQVTCSSPDQT